MFFYQANINIINGKKVYGDLPDNYVTAYENDETGMAYFIMSFKLDEKYVEVTEIDKEEYDQALSDINNLVREKRRVEFEDTKAKVLEKQKVIDELNKSVILLESENADLQLRLAQSTIETIEIMNLLNEQQKVEQAQSNAEMIELLMMMQGGM